MVWIPGNELISGIMVKGDAVMNLIWIVSDTFRKDHLGCYGNKTIHTPSLDALSEKSVRFGLFVDGGNVFDTLDGNEFDLGELRYSAGLSALWLSPMGALGLSIAMPLNEQNGDEVENFQFTFGTGF